MTAPSRLNLPQTLQRSGLYYGWIILFAGTVGIMMSVPGQTMGVSVFTESLIENLHVDRVNLSLAYLFGTLVSSFLLPYVGKVLDRVGARVMSVVASVGLALSLALLAGAPELLSGLMALTSLDPQWTALGFLFVVFLGIRHFGQGQLTMVSRTMIGRWFDRYRGRAIGISGFFTAFAFGIAPLLLNNLISGFGWQQCLMILSASLIGMAILGWLLYRDSPETSGVPLDGGPGRAHIHKSEQPPSHDLQIPSKTADEAKRTSVFWIFNLGLMAHALLGTAMTFHMARIGKLNGLTSDESFGIFLPIAVISTVADLGGGFISDRVQMKYLLAFMQLGLGVGLLSLNWLDGDLGYALTAAGFGISGGLFSLLMGAAWPRLFGRTHLGSIAGLNMAFVVSGSAVGPYLFSLAESLTGSFSIAFTGCALLPMGVLIASFWANSPLHPKGPS